MKGGLGPYDGKDLGPYDGKDLEPYGDIYRQYSTENQLPKLESSGDFMMARWVPGQVYYKVTTNIPSLPEKGYIDIRNIIRQSVMGTKKRTNHCLDHTDIKDAFAAVSQAHDGSQKRLGSKQQEWKPKQEVGEGGMRGALPVKTSIQSSGM
jgi:hypothetical protein